MILTHLWCSMLTHNCSLNWKVFVLYSWYREAARELSSRYEKLLVLPMHGSLPAEHQMRVFQRTPKGTRKVVLATNIAEASITINGIAYGESLFQRLVINHSLLISITAICPTWGLIKSWSFLSVTFCYQDHIAMRVDCHTLGLHVRSSFLWL